VQHDDRIAASFVQVVVAKAVEVKETPLEGITL
jgi:hypothetical protein